MKEITLLGDFLGDAGISGQSGWVLTSQGPKYKVGPKDSPALLAKRYLGDHRAEHHIMSLQSREVQQRGIRTGDVIEMPNIAIQNANALGLIRGLSGFAGAPDEKLTRSTGMGGLAPGHEPHGYARLPPSPSEYAPRSPGPHDLGDLTTSDTLAAFTHQHDLQEAINVTVSTVSATVAQDQATKRQIDQNTLVAWDAFYRGWVSFRANEPKQTPFDPSLLIPGIGPLIASADIAAYYNELQLRYTALKDQWEPNANGWATKIKSMVGGLIGPVSPPSGQPESGTSSTVKWIAIAAIVGGAAYALGPILRGLGKRK